MNLNNMTITTTAGEPFTGQDIANMYHMIWRRFGRNDEAAAEAIRNMMGNSATAHDVYQIRQHQNVERKSGCVYPDGSPANDGKCVQVDNTTTSFNVVVRSMSNVGPESIKDVIETKYEVVKITQNDSQHVVM